MNIGIVMSLLVQIKYNIVVWKICLTYFQHNYQPHYLVMMFSVTKNK